MRFYQALQHMEQMKFVLMFAVFCFQRGLFSVVFLVKLTWDKFFSVIASILSTCSVSCTSSTKAHCLA